MLNIHQVLESEASIDVERDLLSERDPDSTAINAYEWLLQRSGDDACKTAIDRRVAHEIIRHALSVAPTLTTTEPKDARAVWQNVLLIASSIALVADFLAQYNEGPPFFPATEAEKAGCTLADSITFEVKHGLLHSMHRRINAALLIRCPEQHAIEELVYFTNGADEFYRPRTPFQTDTIRQALMPLLAVLKDRDDPEVWEHFNAAVAAILAYGQARESEARDPMFP